MQPIILHIDMNSYFASVEQQDNPSWRGKPVGVCEHLGGIIIAASREAKKWGIGTGTPVWEARKLYPKIILTKTHPDRYRFYTARFLKVFADYTDKVHKYSIDEAFLDVTKTCNTSYRNNRINPWEEAVQVAREIKRRMKAEVGDWLSCSIGVADNKLLAKIASDMQKPDGLVVILPNGVLENAGEHPAFPSLDRASTIPPYASLPIILSKNDLYGRLQLTDIPGIGKRQERNLNELGIHTLKDLRDYSQEKLVARFGVGGYHLYNMGQLHGTWKEEFEEDDIKSIGHMYTLPQEHRKLELVPSVLYKLSEMVAKRLREQELMGNTVSFFLHGNHHESAGKTRKFKFYVYDGRDIFLQAMEMHKTFPPLSVVKLVGITVSGLVPLAVQPTLFGDEKKQQRIVRALDLVNEKYDDFTLSRCLAFTARHAIRDSVGFGRMKEFGKWYGAGS